MEQPRPKNYLIESILVTIFCCQPFGIVGIVFGSQVNSKFSLGDYEGAKDASENAKRWTTWGFIAGLVILVGVLIFYGSIIGLAIANEF